MRKKYFAYGLNIESREMATRCPGSFELGTAVLDGYEFRINSRGVATIIPAEGKKVFGVLWELSDGNFRRLDKFEGVASGFYSRTMIKVIHSGESIEAEIYMASESSRGEPRKGYLERILAASVEHEFPEEYILELESWRRADVAESGLN